MPQPRTSSRTGLVRLALFALLGWALVAFRRRRDEEPLSEADALYDPDAADAFEYPTPRVILARMRKRGRKQRLATSLAFATLFFAGAALSAGAGDMIASAIDPEEAAAPQEATTEEIPPAETAPPESADPGEGAAPPVEEPPAEAPPTDEPAPEEGFTPEDPTTGTDPAAPEGSEAPAPSGGTPPAPGSAPGTTSPAGHGTDAPSAGGAGKAATAAPPGAPVLAPHAHVDDETSRALDPEAAAFGGATVWVHKTLPDPTPPARRLAPAFARMLRAESRRARVDWAVVLGALRADGADGRRPADRAALRAVARTLSASASNGEWQAFLALRGKTAYADRALALTRYNRAVGLRALVVGLDASSKRLADVVLADPRLDVYTGGRADIAAGRIDVRILVLLRYLGEAHGQVTVSSLESGHRIYSRPGVVSAHVYGLAADVSVLGGRPIMGNSQPGGVTEDAVRDILLLPAELRPQQVISLLGLGGPSFPLANHADHIHVGY